MQAPCPPLTSEYFDAVLFDLDGVLTDTAKLHADCWKRMFDEFLRRRSAKRGEPFTPFDADADYKAYVDGKPRYEGVRSFLEARLMELPYGHPDDPSARETICGLGNRKNELIQEVLATEGVELYASSVELVRYLRQVGIRTAVVSSSRNCEAVLAAAGIGHLFDARVDGMTAARDGLAGKPAPDTFLAATRCLGASPARTAVVEDALSGVQAGRAGGFGLVIGVARHGDGGALRRSGADTVVADLEELLPPRGKRETTER